MGYLCSTRGSSPGFLKTLEKKNPQIKSQISPLLRMSWPRVEEEKERKALKQKQKINGDWRKIDQNLTAISEAESFRSAQ